MCVCWLHSSVVMKQKWVSMLFLAPDHGLRPPTLRVGLLSSFKLLWKYLIDMLSGASPRWFQIQSSWQWRLTITLIKGDFSECFYLYHGAVSAWLRIEAEKHRLSLYVQHFPYMYKVSRSHYPRGIYDCLKNSIVFGVRSAGLKRELDFWAPQGLLCTWKGQLFVNVAPYPWL